MKILITLCEGPHDVAFLYRILLTEGFVNCPWKLSEFPAPLNSFLSHQATGENIDDRKLEDVRNRFLPSEALIRNDKQLVLLYAIGGDGKKELRGQLVNGIRSFTAVTDPKAFTPTPAQDKYAIFYLFDADDKGIEKRLSEIESELKEALSKEGTHVEIDLPANGSKFSHENIDYGAYIFARQNENCGKLEDILLPMMRQGNEKIFEDADAYLTRHYDETRLCRLKIKPNEEGIITEKRQSKKGSKYDALKSAIGIAGELQNSGSTNSVCIKHSDYLTLSKIHNDAACQEIAGAFNDLLS